MDAAQIALAHYARVQLHSKEAQKQAVHLWRQIRPQAMSQSWTSLLARFFATMTLLQTEGAALADAYVTHVLASQGISPEGGWPVNPAAFAGIASHGRPLESLLYQPVITAKTAIAGGSSVDAALETAEKALLIIVQTQIADAARVAVGTSLSTRSRAGGYVRMVVGKTCARCVVLAGRWYKWNKGFRRHPRCDCVHIPSREALAEDLTTDPKAWFSSLSQSEQDRVFTKAGAEAIRAGADIGQVVNARRGMATASVYSRQLQVTREGVTRRGLAGALMREQGVRGPRLMPEAIFQISESREQAIQLLRRYGYLF